MKIVFVFFVTISFIGRGYGQSAYYELFDSFYSKLKPWIKSNLISKITVLEPYYYERLLKGQHATSYLYLFNEEGDLNGIRRDVRSTSLQTNSNLYGDNLALYNDTSDVFACDTLNSENIDGKMFRHDVTYKNNKYSHYFRLDSMGNKLFDLRKEKNSAYPDYVSMTTNIIIFDSLQNVKSGYVMSYINDLNPIYDTLAWHMYSFADSGKFLITKQCTLKYPEYITRECEIDTMWLNKFYYSSSYLSEQMKAFRNSSEYEEKLYNYFSQLIQSENKIVIGEIHHIYFDLVPGWFIPCCSKKTPQSYFRIYEFIETDYSFTEINYDNKEIIKYTADTINGNVYYTGKSFSVTSNRFDKEVAYIIVNSNKDTLVKEIYDQDLNIWFRTEFNVKGNDVWGYTKYQRKSSKIDFVYPKIDKKYITIFSYQLNDKTVQHEFDVLREMGFEIIVN